MKNILVISGHGKFATAMKSSIEVLAGGNEDIEYIDFTEDDSETTLKQKMLIVIKEHKDCGVLFICDLLGGTPFKTAVLISLSYENIEVVAGCNLGSILETLFQKDSKEIGEIADFIVYSSNKSTIRFQNNILPKTKNDSEDSLGI